MIRLPLCAIAICPRTAIDHERLRIFDRARAGRGIAGVPDRAGAFQPLQFRLTEDLRDQAHVVVKLETRAGSVARDDAGALLPAMLQREQPVIGQHRRIRMTEHGENAAFVHRIEAAGWSG